MLMWDGKKSVAYTIFYDAVDKIADSTKKKAMKCGKRH
jgi:ribosomal protein S7